MTEYKETKRKLMKEFKINSIDLSNEDIRRIGLEANMKFSAGCFLAPVVGMRVYLLSDEVGNAYYCAQTTAEEPISFHINGTSVEIWKEVSDIKKYEIKNNAEERKLCFILGYVNHLGH